MGVSCTHKVEANATYFEILRNTQGEQTVMIQREICMHVHEVMSSMGLKRLLFALFDNKEYVKMCFTLYTIFLAPTNDDILYTLYILGVMLTTVL